MSTTKVTDAMIDAVAASKLTGALPAISGASLTNLDARDLENALPAISGASLTALPATLPASSGVNLTALNATNLGSGTASVARGGTGAGTHTANNVLVGNGTSAIGSIAPSTSGNVLTSIGSAWASTAVAGGGKVLQVVSVTKTSVFSSTTSTAWTDITGLTLNITPASTGSKIWVTFHGHTDGNHGGYGYGIGLVRDSTLLGLGDAEGSRIRVTSAFHTYGSGDLTIQPFAGSFIDAPSSTSALTYKLQFYSPAATFVVNRYGIDTNSSTRQRPSSTITAIELSAATVSTT